MRVFTMESLNVPFEAVERERELVRDTLRHGNGNLIVWR